LPERDSTKARTTTPLRAVLFDVGGTLWHSGAAPAAEEFRRLAAERAAEMLAGLGKNGHDPAAVARIAWDAAEEAMLRARQGDLREPDYAEVVRQALQRAGLDLERQRAAELLERCYVSGVEGGKRAYEDAAETLAELKRRGFLLATVTNRAFGGERFRADMREAGIDIAWDAEAVSVEVGYLKPHPALFRHALACLGVEPSEALVVGDSLLEDVAGAQRLGMLTAWRRGAPDAEGVEPDYVFDELSELLEIPALRAAGCLP
jgi:HAD superfamily hydrolase (TIGR01509 family)